VTHRERDRDLLGAYALGVLDPNEAHTVDEHLASCIGCRRELRSLAAMRNSLAEVPVEAFLDGPPDDGDLLLRRTLRAVSDDNARARRGRIALIAAGLVVLATVATGAGVLAGRDQGQHDQAQRSQAQRSQAQHDQAEHDQAQRTVPGVRVISATDPRTGAMISTTVTPAAGWVHVHADVRGIKAGKRCQLMVVARGGAPVVAGSWLASSKGETDGTSLDGSALVAAADVAAIEVVTFDNEKLVSAAI
jgi:hypothetical protein